MGYEISGTSISLTRGDTFEALVSVTDSEGNPYVPSEGDSIRFAMKSRYEDYAPILVKDIPIDTMTLVLKPEDTKNLKYGNYLYDIQLTRATGEVDTFIPRAKIKLLEEVD